MIFEEKTIILKDGRTAILKSPCVEDAEKLLNYIKKSCSETDFLARYPEEWTTTIGQEEAWVNRLRSAPDTLGIRDMPGATWRDVVAAVLEECNKAVSLAYLYEQIEPHKKARANQWWKEKIRQTLQGNPEHFDHVGRGLWCIRKSA